MANITVTYRDGRVSQLEQVYIRGSKIRFLILPDMLKNAPMLKSMKNKNQAAGAGRGKAAILKAQGICSLFTPVHALAIYVFNKDDIEPVIKLKFALMFLQWLPEAVAGVDQDEGMYSRRGASFMFITFSFSFFLL